MSARTLRAIVASTALTALGACYPFTLPIQELLESCENPIDLRWEHPILNIFDQVIHDPTPLGFDPAVAAFDAAGVEAARLTEAALRDRYAETGGGQAVLEYLVTHGATCAQDTERGDEWYRCEYENRFCYASGYTSCKVGGLRVGQYRWSIQFDIHDAEESISVDQLFAIEWATQSEINSCKAWEDRRAERIRSLLE